MKTWTTERGSGTASSRWGQWTPAGVAIAGAFVATLVLLPSPAIAQLKLHVERSGQAPQDKEVPKGERGLRSVGLDEGRVNAAGDMAPETAPIFLSINLESATPASALSLQTNERVEYVLRPPPGARFDSGKITVYGRAIGTLLGDARLRFKLQVEAVLSSGARPPPAVTEATLGDQPGSESLEIYASTALPAELDSTRDINLLVTTLLELRGSNNGFTGGTGFNPFLSYAEGVPTTFAVFNSAGVQLTGFTMTHKSGHVVAEMLPAESGIARAIEYYFKSQNNYFVTADRAEMARLDLGLPPVEGWRRTTESFKVYTENRPGTTGICRFYNTKFAPDFAHYYVPTGSECDKLRNSPEWKYEGIVFYMPLPGADGTCAADYLPVYLVSLDYDPSVSPSYRLTTNRSEKLRMLAEAPWEGGEVAMCSPK